MNNKSASAQASRHAQSSKEPAQSKKGEDNTLDNATNGSEAPQPESSTQASNASPDA
jgi:hypothetical protein